MIGTDVRKDSIRVLRNIGEARAKQFKRLGIETVADLLWFFPRAYEDWSRPLTFAEAPRDAAVTVKARVILPPASRRVSGGKIVTRATVFDGEAPGRLVFFNNPYVEKQLKTGATYLFYGKVTDDVDHPQMLSPRFLPDTGADALHAVYPLTAGLTSRIISAAVRAALERYKDALPEALPEEIRRRYRLPGIGDALRLIHFPESYEDVAAAKRRLIYEELLILQLGLARAADDSALPPAYPIPPGGEKALIDALPFALTGAQTRAVSECLADMAGTRPMRRLLQGDVGSGKTAVAAALIAAVTAAGRQSVLMAPTEVLARQHYHTLCGFFAGAQTRIALLTGSTPAAARREVLSALAAGQIDLLVGTHAVIGEHVHFKDLALAVTDEQHRFGVAQRAALREKGNSPHVLVMSATPIPRTLSLIIYGDLSISVLDEKPAGRTPVKTYAVGTDLHPRIYAFLRRQMDEGKQAFIVCPLALKKEEDEEEAGETLIAPSFGAAPPSDPPPPPVSEDLPPALPDLPSSRMFTAPGPRVSAEGLYETLKDTAFGGYPTGLLHGKMKAKEKDAVMRAFAEGKLRLLISTTVIEVGVDVPNANVIVIENAECFGLSQLHQLRGRTGRGADESYCILVSDAKGENARQRMETMTHVNDGFVIAEEDLKLRGPGDFFGERQSGLPLMKIAGQMGDARILYTAAEDAKKIIAADPDLSEPHHALLKESVGNLFADIS